MISDCQSSFIELFIMLPVGYLLLKSTLHKGTSPFANITNNDHKATQGKFGSKLFDTDL